MTNAVTLGRMFMTLTTRSSSAACSGPIFELPVGKRVDVNSTMRTPMLIGLLGNLVNAGLAYSLIYGRFGLPALGVRGAGYGTATTELLELAALLYVTMREGAASEEKAISLREAMREVKSLGVPRRSTSGWR